MRRSASTRALMRRISRTAASSTPPSGQRIGSINHRNRWPRWCRRRLALRAAAPATPTPATSARRPGRTPTSAPAAPADPRAEAQHRPQWEGRAPAAAAVGAARARPRERPRCLTLDRTGQRIGDEHHVGIARVLLLVAAEPTHADHGDAHGQRPRRSASTWRRATPRVPAMVAAVRSDSASADDVDRQQAEDVAGGDADEARGGGRRARPQLPGPGRRGGRSRPRPRSAGPPALAAGVPPRSQAMPRSVLAAAGPTRSGWMPAIAPRAAPRRSRHGAAAGTTGGTELLAHPAEGGQPAVGIRVRRRTTPASPAATFAGSRRRVGRRWSALPGDAALLPGRRSRAPRVAVALRRE